MVADERQPEEPDEQSAEEELTDGDVVEDASDEREPLGNAEIDEPQHQDNAPIEPSERDEGELELSEEEIEEEVIEPEFAEGDIIEDAVEPARPAEGPREPESTDPLRAEILQLKADIAELQQQIDELGERSWPDDDRDHERGEELPAPLASPIIGGGRLRTVHSAEGTTILPADESDSEDENMGALYDIACVHAKLTGAIQVGPNRWKYSWVEVELEEDANWTVRQGGRTSTTDDYAWNKAEVYNSASGTQGNGHNVNDLPTGIGLLPIGPVVVDLIFHANCHDVAEPHFFAMNEIGGSC